MGGEQEDEREGNVKQKEITFIKYMVVVTIYNLQNFQIFTRRLKKKVFG